MALSEYTFKIQIIVEHDHKLYKEYREDVNQGCNHLDNLPSVASYMAQKIKEDISDNKKLFEKYTTFEG